MHKLATENF